MIDAPELTDYGIDPLECITKRPLSISSESKSIKACVFERSSVVLKQNEYRALVEKLHQKNQEMIIVDSLDSLCDEKLCFGKKWTPTLF